MALVPENIKVDGDVNVNLNLNFDPLRVSKAIENIVWTCCFASIIRSRFKK